MALPIHRAHVAYEARGSLHVLLARDDGVHVNRGARMAYVAHEAHNDLLARGDVFHGADVTFVAYVDLGAHNDLLAHGDVGYGAHGAYVTLGAQIDLLVHGFVAHVACGAHTDPLSRDDVAHVALGAHSDPLARIVSRGLCNQDHDHALRTGARRLDSYSLRPPGLPLLFLLHQALLIYQPLPQKKQRKSQSPTLATKTED